MCGTKQDFYVPRIIAPLSDGGGGGLNLNAERVEHLTRESELEKTVIRILFAPHSCAHLNEMSLPKCHSLYYKVGDEFLEKKASEEKKINSL